MSASDTRRYERRLTARNLAETEAIAAAVADVLRRGDIVALDGDLGAGKTAFARALIRRRIGADIDVPSPTFSLVIEYEAEAVTIHHFDLYRLQDREEVFELGIEDAFADGVSVIEWPGILGSLLPSRALRVTIEAAPGTNEEARYLTFTGEDAWCARLTDLGELHDA